MGDLCGDRGEEGDPCKRFTGLTGERHLRIDTVFPSREPLGVPSPFVNIFAVNEVDSMHGLIFGVIASKSSTLVESLSGCLEIFSLLGVHTSFIVSINDSLISIGGSTDEPEEVCSGVFWSVSSSSHSLGFNFNLAFLTEVVRKRFVEIGSTGLAPALFGVGDLPLVVTLSLYFMTSWSAFTKMVGMRRGDVPLLATELWKRRGSAFLSATSRTA